MRASIPGVRIRGICATVPDHVSRFEDEMKNFPFSEKSSRRLAKVMGFNEHRISDAATTPCDMGSYTLNHLFQAGYLDKENIESLIVVAQMADHPIPGNSKIIHSHLGLPKTVYCCDMYENCIGFISGLYAACCQIAAGAASEVALLTIHGGNCRANMRDRNTYPLVGDAVGAALVCKSDDPADVIHFAFGNDSSNIEALMVPAGGCRMPYSAETAKVFQDEMGNYRCLNDLYMDGTAVFQFVMKNVPEIIKSACQQGNVDVADIAYHLMHQPNRFILQKLADLMHLPHEIVFDNIVEYFGNSSPSTIPVNIAYNLGQRLVGEKILACFSGFGAGLSVAAAVARLGGMDFCHMLEHPGNGCRMPATNQ